MHLIPSDAKPFYTSLLSDENVVEDLEGFNTALDFDVEEENDTD